MNAWKHSLSSEKTFGGIASDYSPIHEFLDASKLFSFHLKHRVFLHHLLGIEYCEITFGTTIKNSDQRLVAVRDVAAQHIREDLNGMLPSLNDWLGKSDGALSESLHPIDTSDPEVERFCSLPWLRSGLRSAQIITASHFGVFLAERIHDYAFARKLASVIPPENNPQKLLESLTISEKWQYTPDPKTLIQ